MVSVCLPSDALSQHLSSYFGFSYLGHGVSLHGCSSKVQPLLLTLDEVTPPDLERGVAPFSPPHAAAAPGRGIAFSAIAPDLGRGISFHGCSRYEKYLLTAAPPDLECGVAPLGPPAPAQPLLL